MSLILITSVFHPLTPDSAKFQITNWVKSTSCNQSVVGSCKYHMQNTVLQQIYHPMDLMHPKQVLTLSLLKQPSPKLLNFPYYKLDNIEKQTALQKSTPQ